MLEFFLGAGFILSFSIAVFFALASCVGGAISISDGDQSFSPLRFTLPFFTISASLTVLFGVPFLAPFANEGAIHLALLTIAATIIAQVVPRLSGFNKMDEFPFLILLLFCAVASFWNMGTIIHNKAPDRVAYLDWKLSELEKEFNSKNATMASIGELVVLRDTVALDDEDLDKIKAFIKKHSLVGMNAKSVGVENSESVFFPLPELVGRIGKKEYQHQAALMAEEYKNRDLYTHSHDEEDVVYLHLYTQSHDEEDVAVASDKGVVVSSKITFLYNEQMFVGQLTHKQGKCFDVKNKAVNLNACYDNGEVAVRFTDDEQGFSVAVSYGINEFLNGPINLNNIVQNRGGVK